MAANLAIDYSPSGIPSIRERQFVQRPTVEAGVEDARRWATELAEAVFRKNFEPQLDVVKQAAEAGFTAVRFHNLAVQWNNETAHYSVSFKRAMHSSYQQIIGMGEKALPHIFKRLREEPGRDWFWALKAITGEDAAANAVDVESAIAAWIGWAERHNL